MAIRQYIGARYVPTYYVNSQDPTSSEWEPNVNYDPLTIVSLPNMHSYQSKKFVPASVGSPASNPEYWYDQGYANAYYQALQNQIDDMKDSDVQGSLQNQIDNQTSEINAIGNISSTNNKAIFIGDSFMVTGVQNAIANKFGITADNAYYYGNTGAGFCHVNPLGEPWGAYNFKGCLELALAKVIDDGLSADDINYIFVLGGINDQNETLSDFESAVNTFMSYARSTFKNARILVGANGPRAALSFAYTHMIDLIYQYADMYGCYALRGIEHTLYAMANLVDSDNIHPNANGVNVLAYYFKAMYLGNDPYVRAYEYDANGTYCTGKVKVFVDRTTVTIFYALTWVDNSGGSTGITLQERAIPGFVVCDAPGCNVPGAYFEINNGGVVNVWGTKSNGTLYCGTITYPVGRN